jgi:ABC-type bacteriocin/lantibiotic exporter with double-glycine peptidase domain
MENEYTPEVEQVNETNEEQEKPQLTPEQIQGAKRRQLTKLAKEFGIELPKHEEKEEVKNEEKKVLDINEKTYLIVNKVDKEDYDFILDEMKETGKPIDKILEFKYVRDALEERMNERKTQKATQHPPTTSRAGNAVKDSVDWYLKKGELPPPGELRNQYLDRKRESGDSGSKFTSRPVA